MTARVLLDQHILEVAWRPHAPIVQYEKASQLTFNTVSF